MLEQLVQLSIYPEQVAHSSEQSTHSSPISTVTSEGQT